MNKCLAVLFCLVGLSGLSYGQSFNGIPNQVLAGAISVTTLTASGALTATSDGVHQGQMALVGNTTAAAIPANQFGWLGFLSTSATALFLQPSSTSPTATQLMEFGAPSGNISAQTWVNPTGLTTTAQCLAAAVPITTPCIAYQSGAVTALTSASGGTPVTLYTTSAPSGGVFQFNAGMVQDTFTSGTAGGFMTLEITGTTPAGVSISTAVALATAFAGTAPQFGTSAPYVFTTGNNSTLSFNVLALTGTGVLTWEYNLVVMRLR